MIESKQDVPIRIHAVIANARKDTLHNETNDRPHTNTGIHACRKSHTCTRRPDDGSHADSGNL